MSVIIIPAVLCFITAVIIIIGIRYIRAAKAAAQRRNTKFNKQRYVKEQRKQFGASNRGTSMDGRKIYAKSPSELGL